MEKVNKKTKDERIYIKNEDGSFSPVGMPYERDWLGEGLWYVRASSITNGSYMGEMMKLSDKPLPPFTRICELQDYVDYILSHEAIKSMLSSNKGYSLLELVCKIVAIMNEKIEKDTAKK